MKKRKQGQPHKGWKAAARKAKDRRHICFDLTAPRWLFAGSMAIGGPVYSIAPDGKFYKISPASTAQQ